LKGWSQTLETGDADADGRLSLADAVLLFDALKNGEALPEGVLERFEQWPCFLEMSRDSAAYHFPPLVYLEALRRGVESSLSHWINVWGNAPPAGSQGPLSADGRFEVERLWVAPTPSVPNSATVFVQLLIFESVRSYSLVLDVDGSVLRPAQELWPLVIWSESGWMRLNSVFAMGLGPCGDLWCSVTPSTFLVTGGKLVVSYPPDEKPIAPGAYQVSFPCRLPVRTLAGSYHMRIHPASEVVFEDGTFGAPLITDPSHAEADLVLAQDVDTGWDEGVPPLVLDAQNQRVSGEVKFRLADKDGNVPAPGQPLFSGLPGEEFDVRVQMWTEVPLNHIRWTLMWKEEGLECANWEFVNLFTNPEDGFLYAPAWPPDTACSSRGSIRYDVEMGGYYHSHFTNYEGRPLEYFKPLSQWVDMVQVALRIRSDAQGGSTIPLQFAPVSPVDGPLVQFAPYQSQWPCARRPWCFWRYTTRAEGGWVQVLGDQPPPSDPELGVHFELSNATASPGELIEIPVYARTEKPVAQLQLALEYDFQAVSVEGFIALITGGHSGEEHQVPLTPGGQGMIEECVEVAPGVTWCLYGIPVLVRYLETAEGTVLLKVFTGPSYPGGTNTEVGRLLVRVRDKVSVPEVQFRPAKVRYEEDGFLLEVETGGFELMEGGRGRFSPVASFSGGIIRFKETGFVRGDANADGEVDLTDAVVSLLHLFMGEAAPACFDAADTDDNGDLDISDPIYLLSALFKGGSPIPQPYPDCGKDDTPDELSCADGGPCGP